MAILKLLGVDGFMDLGLQLLGIPDNEGCPWVHLLTSSIVFSTTTRVMALKHNLSMRCGSCLASACWASDSCSACVLFSLCFKSCCFLFSFSTSRLCSLTRRSFAFPRSATAPATPLLKCPMCWMSLEIPSLQALRPSWSAASRISRKSHQDAATSLYRKASMSSHPLSRQPS